MKQYLAAALILTAPYTAAQSAAPSCDQFVKPNTTLEGKIHQEYHRNMLQKMYKRQTICYEGCGVGIIVKNEGYIALGGITYKELSRKHGKTVKVTGTYHPDVMGEARCTNRLIMGGAPFRSFSIQSMEEIRAHRWSIPLGALKFWD